MDDLISDEMIVGWRKKYGFPNSVSRQANFTGKTTSSAGKISGAGGGGFFFVVVVVGGWCWWCG